MDREEHREDASIEEEEEMIETMNLVVSERAPEIQIVDPIATLTKPMKDLKVEETTELREESREILTVEGESQEIIEKTKRSKIGISTEN